MIDGRTYVRGNAAYAAHIGIPEVERGFVCSVGEGALLEEWAPLLRPADLVASLLEGSESLAVRGAARRRHDDHGDRRGIRVLPSAR